MNWHLVTWRDLFLAVLLLALHASAIAQQNLIPAFPAWPARTVEGNFGGALRTPQEACAASIVPTDVWTCGMGYQGTDPLYVCQQSFVNSGLPTLAAAAKLEAFERSGSISYRCTAPPQYPFALCILSRSAIYPPTQLYYHPEDGTATGGYCVDENDSPRFNLSSRKMLSCPKGWQLIRTKDDQPMCSGSCPEGEQVNIDTISCSPFHQQRMATNLDEQSHLRTWMVVRDAWIKFNHGAAATH